MKINLSTTVQGMWESFRVDIGSYEEKDFHAAIRKEKSGRNRTTIINLLKKGLRYKSLGLDSF